jgi:hypothetical protein
MLSLYNVSATIISCKVFNNNTNFIRTKFAHVWNWKFHASGKKKLKWKSWKLWIANNKELGLENKINSDIGNANPRWWMNMHK